MRRALLSTLMLGFLTPPIEAEAAPRIEPPRLIVLIVVDQLGRGLLERHANHLSGGFRRLIDRGRRFEDALVDHAPTNSLPGHLTAASGAHPRRHGIVDNSWVEASAGAGRRVLGFAVPRCATLTGTGPEAESEGLGPGRFEASTIVEWVRAADPRARSASVGTGGGVSVLHAGRATGPVLWFSPAHSGYVGSSCYADSLPEWAVGFNERLRRDFMSADWTLSAPAAMLAGLRPDEAAFEHRGRDAAFPHARPTNAEVLPRWFHDTPFADAATLTLAGAAVEGEGLGADGVTDILTIGLSSLDHVGHAYGPYSVEQADSLYRLDHALGAFFDRLDREVGPDRWTVGLTADHGAPPAPEDAARFGIGSARRVNEAEAQAAISRIMAAAEGIDDPRERTRAAARAAVEIDFVARVLTPADMAAPAGGDEIARLYTNSFRPGRTSRHPLYDGPAGRGPADFGLIVVPHPYVVVDWATSIHGSPYRYDRAVEIMFMGPGVAPGTACGPARTVDVAPSLAAVAGIAPLNEVDGRVLPLAEPAGGRCPSVVVVTRDDGGSIGT